MNFFGAFSGLPLRPLLLAAGAAAATASIYTYVKRSEDTTAEPEDTTEGPDTEVVKDQMMHPFERVIFVIQKLLVSKIQLQDRVKELEELLCEAHRDCDLKSKVTLAEAEEKHQKDVETIHQLEKEKSDLTEKVEALRETVEDMGNQLIETNRECDELLNERETHNILQAENDEMKKTITQLEEEKDEMKKTITQLEEEKDEMKKTLSLKEELLKVNISPHESVTLAEAEEKHQKDVETIHQLEKEKSDLTEKVEALRETVEDMGNQLIETNRECDELLNERETHNILQAENDEMKKTITQLEEEKDEMKTLSLKEELLKVTLAEAEEKHQKDVETIHQLEKEKSDLTEKVEALRETVEDMGNQLIETNRECDELLNERETHNILQAENDEMKKTLSHKEELLKVTLAEAEEKHQKDVETIHQLEKEKSDLIIEMETLRNIVKNVGKKLVNCNRKKNMS
ncbi:hypothetical protein KOW79_006871 [Hemibagrus wyckioides]|uniref:Uncharacterized protein n=1 Tax=Hemibagrus wyckioides TaxID=337641 RepID=A0A9D3SSW3_9TELE|nr:hypothetical protein KOW79_006871 [Hemibagrus wyckioides]